MISQNSLSFVLVLAFSKERGSWPTMTKDLFAKQVTVICAGRLNPEVNGEPVRALDKKRHHSCY